MTGEGEVPPGRAGDVARQTAEELSTFYTGHGESAPQEHRQDVGRDIAHGADPVGQYAADPALAGTHYPSREAYARQDGGADPMFAGDQAAAHHQPQGYHEPGAGSAALPAEETEYGVAFDPAPDAYQQGGAYQQGDMYQKDDAEFYSDDPGNTPYEDESAAYAEFESRRPKGLFVLLALAGAVLVGGGLAFAYKQFAGGGAGSGGPQVIAADSRPVKFKPAKPGGRQFRHQGKAIYERFGKGGSRLAGRQSSGRDSATTSPDSAPAAIPGLSVTFNAGGGGSSEPSARAQGARPRGLRPSIATRAVAPGTRKVRTVAVRLNRRAIAPASTRPTRPINVASVRRRDSSGGISGLGIMPQGRNAPVPKLASRRSTTSVTARATARRESAIAKPTITLGAPSAMRSMSSRSRARGASTGMSSAGTSMRWGKPKPATGRAQRSRQTSARGTVRLAGRPPAMRAPVAGGAIGGYVVQVSSRRKRIDALAAFANMQQKFASLLKGKQPDIQEAQIPKKGTWYRLRIGPPASRDAAKALCSNLKSAGMRDCVVRSY